MVGAFPKINALGTRFVKDIFQNDVEITEKLDGSQFGFGKINGELITRSKGAIQDLNNPDTLFKEGVEYIKSIQDRLPDNMFFYGEIFKKPKHNTLCYDRIPKNHIALFGAVRLPDNFVSRHSELEEWANRFDIEVIPLLYQGKVDSIDFIYEFMDRTSALGGAKIEGVVVKNYYQNVILTQDIVLPLMAGKFVSEEFKEVHRGRWKTEETKGGKLQTFMEGFRTPARWDKAIIHLRERGELTETPKDIGLLMKEVSEDIEAEEIDYIKDQLYVMFRKDLLKVATNGLPEYYKEKLATNSTF